MIRIALCDDEKNILDEITCHIQNYAKVENVSGIEIFPFNTAGDLKAALDDKCSFDIFILDVYIGSDMGTSLAKDIRRRGIESPIIFVSTSIDHAPMGYELGTLRYLIKPIDRTKLYEALTAATIQAEKLVERLIKLKTENGIESLNANRIMYTEAHDHYQFVMLDGGNQIKVRMTVSELFALLARNDGFVRVGSAYIVNLRNIKNVTTSSVHLYNDISIPIPRGKHTELKRAFWNFQCEGQEI